MLHPEDDHQEKTAGSTLIFKLLRNAGSAPERGKVCIVGRNPDAVWFDGFEDRVLFDEAGLFEYSRVTNPNLSAT